MGGETRRVFCLALAGGCCALALTSCYSPTLGNPGFYCHPSDDPPCPDGQVCVGNRCVTKKPGLNFDGGVRDMSGPPVQDMATSAPDLSTPVRDMATGGCVTVPNWNGVTLAAGYQAPTTLIVSGQNGGDSTVLIVEDWHLASSYPKTVTHSTADNYSSCDVCTYVREGCTSTGCTGPDFFAQGGSTTVTRADQDDLVGQMSASVSSVRLVEWDFTGDSPIAGGRCYLVTTASMTGSWP